MAGQAPLTESEPVRHIKFRPIGSQEHRFRLRHAQTATRGAVMNTSLGSHTTISILRASRRETLERIFCSLSGALMHFPGNKGLHKLGSTACVHFCEVVGQNEDETRGCEDRRRRCEHWASSSWFWRVTHDVPQHNKFRFIKATYLQVVSTGCLQHHKDNS